MARTIPKPDMAGGAQPAKTDPNVVYGQGGANVAAQNEIPLPDSRGIPRTIGGTNQQAQIAQPQQSALEEASAYQPDVMSLNAPDDQAEMDVTAGLIRHFGSPKEEAEKRNEIIEIQLMEQMAAVTGDPYLISATERKRAISRSHG
jgi:hypothetical protein